MEIYDNLNDIAAFSSAHPLHLALGYFDGVHLGHQALLGRALRLAEEMGGEPGILLLEPHPQKTLKKNSELRILTPLDKKIQWIRAYGKIHIFILTFDRAFAEITPENFVKDYLVGLFRIRTAVCGYNYHFGNRGAGNVAVLRKLALANGFSCSVLPQVTAGRENVSTSAIRSLIETGSLFDACTRLGHCQIFSGRVAEGRKLGGQIGFPTANLELDRDSIWPAFGVYGCFVRDDQGCVHRGIVNVGLRPTVNTENAPPSFEAFLPAFHGDLYNRGLQVALTGRIRPEIAFDGLSALQAQIAKDVKEADSLLDKWENHLREKGWLPDSLFSCFIKDYPI